ncbi:hypothetical protein H072_1203 [Dactylellina haptotyla CBS 200.50]|uniref:Uncharacterized protein n=1 Tax=Dactylellina haptotyla (strain CBS 200.50) TaxID=1284197 RepID=S8AV30_DACHA|nr:hypothetical protein H072_1203 [Dactylellina haptotyla CBS 200.50]
MGKAAARFPSPGSSVDLGTSTLDDMISDDKTTHDTEKNMPKKKAETKGRPSLSSLFKSASSKSSDGLFGRKFYSDPIEAFFGLSTPYFFLIFSTYTLTAFPEWSLRWWLSGIPLLCFLILLGAHKSELPNTHPAQRLPYIAAILFIHLILSTSWLAYYILAVLTWPFVAILAIANYTVLQGIVRKSMREMGRDMHYFQDKIACFDLPALDIDVRANGMMVIEGATFTLSTLTLEAHGIEVALQVDDGLEVCFRTEKAIARFGRCVEIGDVYITLKTEMDTGPGSIFAMRRSNTIDTMLESHRPEQLHPKSLSDAIEQVKDVTETQYPDEDEEHAIRSYTERVNHIHENTAIHTARKRLSSLGEKYSRFTAKEKKAMIASALQTAASITHPPTWSIAVSHLKARTPPWIHEFNNRFPMIQRTMLNVIAHLHPVKCNGVVGNVTGLFASGMLERAVFKHYKNENREISKLASRVQTWLETGNFVCQFSKINGVAQVPSTVSYDIIASIKTSTVQVFKVLVAPEISEPLLDEDDTVSVDSAASNASAKSGVSVTIKDKVGIKQEEDKGISEVARINGVSSTVEVPSLLLPHHEYLFPAPPASKTPGSRSLEKVAEDVTVHFDEDDRLEDDVLSDDFDGRKAAAGLVEDEGKDEVMVIATVLASLPAQFNSTILHFATALLKASKLIEIEKEVEGKDAAVTDDDDPSMVIRSRSLGRVGSKISKTMKRTFTGVVDDAWIAKLMGRLVGKVEGLKGEVGYKMPIPVDLKPRRLIGLGPKGTAVDYGLFTKDEVRELWPDDNPYRRNC